MYVCFYLTYHLFKSDMLNKKLPVYAKEVNTSSTTASLM